MSLHVSLNDLLDYTAWERESWLAQLRKHGDPVLKISAGPHGDGRFQAVGELVRHIFSAEKRYVDWLSERPLTDAVSIPIDKLEPLFEFGRQSRRDLNELLKTFPAQEWDATKDFKILEHVIRVTPRKIVTHVLMHEIRILVDIGVQTCCITCIEKVHGTTKSGVFNSLVVRQIQLIGERRLFNMPFQPCPTRKSILASDCELCVAKA